MYRIVTNFGPEKIGRKDFTREFIGDAEMVFVPFWSWKIPKEIYENHEIVIFHMTDLPYGRGGSPLQNLVVRGHKNTAISAIRCVEEIDAGPVYMKVPFNICYGNADQIYQCADVIIRGMMIPHIWKYRPEPKPQEGTPVYFDRWNCTRNDILRVTETDYECFGGGGAS